MARSYLIVWITILLTCWACSSEHMLKIQVDELYEKAMDVRYSNLNELAKIRDKLAAIDNDRARALTRFFSIHLECQMNFKGCAKKMREIYPEIKKHNFRDIVYEIDFLYLRYYPGTDDEAKTIQDLEYLEQPSFAFEKELYRTKIANYFDHKRFEKSENLYREFLEKYAHRKDSEHFNILKNQFVLGLMKTNRYEEAKVWAEDLLVEPSSTLLEICAYDRLAEITYHLEGTLDYTWYYYEKMDKLLKDNNFVFYYYHFQYRRAAFLYKVGLYEESLQLSKNVLSNGPFTSKITGGSYLQSARTMIKLSRFDSEDILYYFEQAESYFENDQYKYTQVLQEKLDWFKTFDQQRADSLKLVIKDILLASGETPSKMSDKKLSFFLKHYYTNQKLEELEAQKKINTTLLNNKKYIWGLTAISCLLGLTLFFLYKKSLTNIELVQVQETKLKTVNDELTDKNKFLNTQNRHKNKVLRNLRNNNQHLFRFASVAANRINTPLKSIEKNAEHLYNRYRDVVDVDDRELFDFVLSSCGNLQNMISGLLQFSKITSLSQKPMAEVDLNILVANVVNMLSSSLTEKNGKIITPQDMPVVVGYASLIEQLFLNLLGNAIKFTEPDIAPHIEIKFEIKDEWVQISITDNGVGIPEKFHHELFQFFRRFHKSRFSGSGIGLATCKKIVDMHEGDIWVKSNQNQGTTFLFTLPKSKVVLSGHTTA